MQSQDLNSGSRSLNLHFSVIMPLCRADRNEASLDEREGDDLGVMLVHPVLYLLWMPKEPLTAVDLGVEIGAYLMWRHGQVLSEDEEQLDFCIAMWVFLQSGARGSGLKVVITVTRLNWGSSHRQRGQEDRGGKVICLRHRMKSCGHKFSSSFT